MITAFLSIFLGFLHIPFSIIVAMKMGYFLVFYLSSVVIYKFIKDISKDKFVAFLGSVFYLTLPFKLWDVFVRDGYTEIWTFLFIPMLFYGLYLLLYKQNKKGFYFFFIIGSSGVVLSHIVTTMFVVIAGIIFLVWNYKKLFKKDILLPLGISCLWILGICSFYIFPFLEHRVFGNYQIFNSDITITKQYIMNSVLTLKDFVWPNHIVGGTDFFIPIPLLLGFILSIVSYIRLRKTTKIPLFGISLGLVILFLGISMSSFFWEHVPTFIYMIQYVFRLLILPFFFTCLIAPLFLLFIQNNKLKYIITFIFVILSVGIAYKTTDHFYITDYNMYSSDISTNGMGWQKEYLPVKAYQNKEEIENHDGIIHVNNDIVTISNEQKNFDKLEATINNPNHQNVSVELPYLYYLGYDIRINNEKITPQENEKGLVSFTTNQEGTLKVSYTGTNVTRFTQVISLVSMIGFTVFMFMKRR